MRWHEKSRSSDVMFCNNRICNVLTFRNANTPICPSCSLPGSKVRDAKMIILKRGIRSEDQAKQEQST